MPSDMHEWRYERDLKLDLFATQRWRGGQDRYVIKRAREMRYCLGTRAFQRALPGLAPPFYCGFGHVGLAKMMRKQLRLDRSVGDDPIAQRLGDAAI